MFLNNEDIAIDDATALYERRDNPSALEYDWVSQRLFWGEDGDRVSGCMRQDWCALFVVSDGVRLVIERWSKSSINIVGRSFSQ